MTTPTLTRTLKLPRLVLFGLAYLTPLIVLGIFGIIAETTGGASPAAYLVAHGRHAVHGAQLRPDGRRVPRGRFRLHLRPPVHRSPGGVPGGLGHPAGLPLPAHGHLAHRRLLPDRAVPRNPHRSLDRGLHPHHHAAEHPGHQGGGQGQLRADGVPAAGHRVLRGAVHRQRGVHLRAPAAWPAPSRSSTTPPASPPSPPVPPSPRTRSSGSTPSPPSPRRPSNRARTCPAPSCSSP